MMFNTETDLVDCELAWSSDTVQWERVCPGTPLIPRGPDGSFDWGCVYGAAYPFLKDGRLQAYYGGSNAATPTGGPVFLVWQLCDRMGLPG